jgi:gliding motility-associated-like protein
MNFKSIMIVCSVLFFNILRSQNGFTAPEAKTGKFVATRKTPVKDQAPGIVKTEKTAEYNVSNVITPNCESVNHCDRLQLFDTTVSVLKATIYDQWGNIMKEVVNVHPSKIWFGDDNAGKPCKAGTYFYILYIRDKHGLESDLKGNISVFR